jgi:hypothetical protein
VIKNACDIIGFSGVLLIIFGYAVDFDVHHVKTVIFDKDNSEKSKKLIEKQLTRSILI